MDWEPGGLYAREKTKVVAGTDPRERAPSLPIGRAGAAFYSAKRGEARPLVKNVDLVKPDAAKQVNLVRN